MLANRVREYTLTTGTGDITLAGAMAAHIRFSDAFAAGETVTYVIEDGDNYEIGTGTLLDATTLRRTTVGETLVDGVYDRSAPDAIALSGSARVYCAATAEFLLDPTEAADVIREVTLDAGVTVDGVLLKDGGANLTGDLVSGGAVGVGIAPAYTLDIENPDTNFYVGRWKRQGASLPGFLYSDTAGAGFTFGTNAFSGSGSKGGLYFGNNANIYLPENNGDLFIVDDNSRKRFAFRDDGVLTWNSGAISNEGSGYLSWATNKAIVSAKSGAYDLILRGGGSDNLTLGSDGSSVFGGAVRFDAGAQALTLLPGAEDHTFIGFNARSASPNTRSGYIGYASTVGTTTMTFSNQLPGGTQQFNTNGYPWLIGNADGSATFFGDVQVAGSLQLNNNQVLNWLDSGGSPRNGIVWDASNNLNLYSGQSNAIQWLISSTGDLVGNGGSIIRRNLNTSTLTMSGGLTGSQGGAIILYGNAEATNANDLAFLSAGGTKLNYDADANHWNFQGNDIVANLLEARYFLRGIATSDSIISGGTNGSSGGNILLYGESHATNPNDILIRSSSITRLQWDQSALSWDFKTNLLTGINDIRRGAATGDLTISGGSNLFNGANIVFFGESHANNANDIKFRKNSDDILSYSSSGFNWNFRGNEIKGVAALHGDATSTALDIYSGPDTTGANIILYGSAHGVQPNDILFRTGATTRLQWDNSADLWTFLGKNVSGVATLSTSDVSLSGHLIKNVDNSSVVLSGSNSPVLGGNIVLRGHNHPTVANDIEFRSNSSVRLQWDDSGNYWSFAGHRVTGIPLLSRGSTSSFLEMSGGDAASGSGANILLHGPSYPSFANDIQFRTGTTVRLSWDDINSRWDCSSNPLFNVGNVFMGGSVLSKTSSSGSLTLTGGTGSSLGASIELFAQSHATRPNDFELRAGTTSVLRWDDGVSQLEIAQRMTVDTGGQSFTLLPGAADHAYIAFNARTASPTARSGYIGYASAATAGMSFVNEVVGPQQFITNGITWLIGSSSGAATFFGNVINQSQMQLKSYMVANLPSASSPGAGSVIFVTDDAGGPVPAFSDGINFRRITDRNIVSSSAITELTISSGAITITKSFHAIDTESDASSDELDTINGGQDGDEITLVAEDDARSITLRHNIGNIRLSGSNNFTLSSLSDTITLIKRGANWLEKSRSNSS